MVNKVLVEVMVNKVLVEVMVVNKVLVEVMDNKVLVEVMVNKVLVEVMVVKVSEDKVSEVWVVAATEVDSFNKMVQKSILLYCNGFKELY